MRISLVSMPWHSLDRPSLALGILRQTVARCKDEHQVAEYYGNLAWAEMLFERSSGRITPIDYFSVSDVGIFLGMGDWIFAASLYNVSDWRTDEYQRYLSEHGIAPALALEMQGYADEFVEQAADEVLAQSPDLVGFTTTFMQNVPSLALARRLKQRRPDLITVFGGANCEGPMGAALHRNFAQVDYVVRGEGEHAFVELLDGIGGHNSVNEVAGVCWRDSGKALANAERVEPCPIADVPAPDYGSYFDRLSVSSLKARLDPKIVLEAARGCWWGEKHQCTFCGLNGAMMRFRSKSPERVWQEMSDAVERYQSLDIIMVDNIIDMRYFKTLLPRIASVDWDLKIHYEVKSNLRDEHVQALEAARVFHIQPGIENLSSRVLELMRKGVSGPQNVQLLREGEEHGLTISWNYLYGFPSEEPPDYDIIIEQMPALSHLQPPYSAARIALERFSPNFDDASLGFVERQPAEFYRFVYELPPSELSELVYLFDTADQGIGGDVEGRLQLAIADWRKRYPSSTLTYRLDGERLIISERRAHRPPGEYVFEDPVKVAAYLALRSNTTARGLWISLVDAGHAIDLDSVEHFLAELKRFGLVFEDRGFFVALAIRDDPTRTRVAI